MLATEQAQQWKNEQKNIHLIITIAMHGLTCDSWFIDMLKEKWLSDKNYVLRTITEWAPD